jgi:hypothetical protein
MLDALFQIVLECGGEAFLEVFVTCSREFWRVTRGQVLAGQGSA